MKSFVHQGFLVLAGVILPLLGMSTPLDPPNVECAVVSAVDGSINLTWTAPADPLNEFTAYNIYEINPGTLNAVLVTTVTNYNNTTLTVP